MTNSHMPEATQTASFLQMVGNIAKLDGKRIGAVHFCNLLSRPKGPITHDPREVWTGAGQVPLKEWVDAVRAMG